MPTTLKASPKTEHALGYIQYIFPAREPNIKEGTAAHEFLEEFATQNPIAHTTLPIKGGKHYNAYKVYFKSTDNHWHEIAGIFLSIQDILPFIQSGIRVIIEYFRPNQNEN